MFFGMTLFLILCFIGTIMFINYKNNIIIQGHGIILLYYYTSIIATNLVLRTYYVRCTTYNVRSLIVSEILYQ